MLNGHSSSANAAATRIAILFLLAWVLVLQGDARADSPKGSGREAEADVAARSVRGMKLKVSANGRYFVDQDGKPFFYLGDTCWLLFQRLNREEVEEYLKDRAAKGFTVIQAYVIRGLDKRHPDGNSSLLGETPFIDRDPTRPNEAFFKNVDYVVNRANELGLVMGLVTAKSWHVNEHPEKVFNEKNAYTFGKFLGERYKNNAVMWYPGGDSAPGGDEAVWVAMARGLKDGSGGTHLVSYHGNGQSSSSTWFSKATWLDFNSIQSGHGWAAKTYRFIDKDYGLTPARPTVDMEPPYENHPTGGKTPRIDAHQVRKGAYWNMLAGAAGHGYGALDLFWLYKDGDGPFPKSGFQPWRKAMAYEGSRQVGFMRRLFELRPWYKLVPDQSVIAAGQGEGEDLVRAARAEDGSFLIAYLPTGKPVSIKMDKVSGKAVKAQWYDPREGTWRPIGEYPNTGNREFLAPSQGERSDWVLVLEDAAKGFPTARSAASRSQDGPIVKGQRLFSTGHSFHAGFPPILEVMAKEGGFKDHTTVGVSSIGGSKVVQHVGGKAVTAALTDGMVDVLMTTPIYLPDPGVEQFAKLGFDNNPDIRVTMMEFWLPFDQYEPRHYSSGPKGSPTEHIPPPKKVEHDAVTGDSLRKMHEQYFKEMDELVVAINKKLGKPVVFVVPVGQAAIALREKIIAGQAPGLKAQEDLFTDGLGHPKPALTILMGYCHYAVIYRKSPVGLPVPKQLAGSKSAEELNRLLQELAWNAVIHHPLSGVKVDAGAKDRLPAAPTVGPLRASKNPNYFEDASGNPLILCGSHTWNTLQDWGTNGTVRPLDFDAFVAFLKAHGHSCTLLWYTELPRFRGLPTTEKSPPDFTVGPHPWMRTGPGNATDGGLKFDLTKFDQEYFDRLRARVKALHGAGIYVGVYLFTGEFQLRFRFRSDGYPFSGPNNVNGVDDGYRGGAPETGLASVTMTAPNAITDLQDAYVKKAIDTLNDLPNVLWIVSEEAPTKSTWWNSHLISLVRAHEKGKRYQHPIGYATLGEKPMDSILYDSDADWVAPWARVSPPKSCGTGNPACKVNINDSDHSYFGMWNETPQKNRNYAWENFTTGNQVLFMDPYLVHYPREKRNLCISPVNGIGDKPDPRWENFRNNLGYILKYSRKLNLARVTPSTSLCSTKHCLAQTPAAGAEYLVYAPSGGPFTIDLSAMPNSRMLAVEWFNPATGETIAQDPIKAGASSQSFTPPFNGDAVLYLVDIRGRR